MRASQQLIQRIGIASGVIFTFGWLCGCSPSSPAPAAGLVRNSTNLVANVKSNLVQAVQGGKTNEVAAAENRSVFNDKLKDARDPFFPNWTPHDAKAAGTNGQAAVVAKPPPESLLELNSIVGSANLRLASINGRTFLVGEEKTISTSSGDVRVRCLQVNAQSVTVAVNGRSEHKILSLSKRPN